MKPNETEHLNFNSLFITHLFSDNTHLLKPTKNHLLYLRNQIQFKNDSFAMVIDRKVFDQTMAAKVKDFIAFNEVFRITDDNLGFRYWTWTVSSNSGIFLSLEKFILESHQHGIIRSFESKYETMKRKFTPQDDPKVLTMYTLSAGLYIWLGSVAIACITFVTEHVVFHIHRKIQDN